MSRKSQAKKIALVRAHRSARSVPVFVRVKTARRVTSNPKRRHWHTSTIKNKPE